jgi:hypothetical protein
MRILLTHLTGLWLAAAAMAVSEPVPTAPGVPGTGTGDFVPPDRVLNQFVTTEVGLITLSADGLGTISGTGNLQVEKPSAGATVRVAYLLGASTGFTSYIIPNGGVQLAGTPVTWSHSIVSGIQSYNHLANVTAIVAPILNPAAAGIINIPVVETNSLSIDGTALYVIFNDPATTVTRTAVLAFGAQATTGDNFSIGFGQPVFPGPNTVVEFGLAISYGYARGTCQTSYVDVNGMRLTSSAGGDDDGQDQNGALMTVGGVGDSRANPVNPMFNDPCSWTDYTNYDDELYNIAGFIGAGSTSMSVHTFNPSNDDNIFAAHLLLDFAAVVGEGGVLTPAAATSCLGDPRTMTLTLQDSNGNPLVNYAATIAITSGPNAGYSASGNTGATGQFAITYTSAAAGTDVVRGSFINSSGVLQYSNTANVAWQSCAANESGALSPLTASTCVGNPHTVTLTLQDGNGAPLVGYQAGILVIAGPNVGQTVSGLSDANGRLTMSTTSGTPGTDLFQGSFTNSSGIVETTATAENTWLVCQMGDIGVLAPLTAATCLGDQHTLTLTLENPEGLPLVGHWASIELVAGPNAGLAISGNTDVNGELNLTYTSSLLGTDLAQGAFIDSYGVLQSSNDAESTWRTCTAGAGAELTPFLAVSCVGDSYTATLTLHDANGDALANHWAWIDVFEGPNTGLGTAGYTDAFGRLLFTYTSGVVGTDKLLGSFIDAFGEQIDSNEIDADWIECVLESPVIQISASATCGMLITWEAIPGATEYRVWSSAGLDQPWILEDMTPNLFFPVGCVGNAQTKLFQVTAVNN